MKPYYRLLLLRLFWKTGWAFAIYIMLICMAMYMTFRLIHKFAILRNRIQLEKQLTEYKLVFFYQYLS